MSTNWFRTDVGDWVNLSLVERVHFDPEGHATLYLLGGTVVSIGDDIHALRALLEGEIRAPQDSLIGAYRKG